MHRDVKPHNVMIDHESRTSNADLNVFGCFAKRESFLLTVRAF